MKLKSVSTSPPEKFHKDATQKETAKLKLRLDELQNLLYAGSKHALLVVFQGMDASGKDGAVKNVFGGVNPLGCKVFAFKKPTELEMKHDFLWRIHQHVPEHGMIHIFNRSHYEDVLVQRVHKWIDEKTVKQRFGHINDFEKLLTESGITVLKFYLHISKEKQLERLRERMTDKTKMWKYNEEDLNERKLWNKYMNAYEDVFSNCGKISEWNIIPADHNWYKEYLVAQKVVETLEGLKMKYPGMKRN